MHRLFSSIALAFALAGSGCSAANPYSIHSNETTLNTLPAGLAAVEPLPLQPTPAARSYQGLWDSTRKLSRWLPPHVKFHIDNNGITKEQIEWANAHRVYVSVSCDNPIADKEIQYIDCRFSPDKNLLHLAEMPHIHGLILNLSQYIEYNKAALRKLIASPQLLELNVYSSRFDDEDLQALSQSHSLRELHLSDSDVSDRGLALLGQMTQLHTLSVGRSPTGTECHRDEVCSDPEPAPALSREILAVLSRLHNLRTLSIDYADIRTDADIKSLQSLKHLLHLRLAAPLNPQQINEVLSFSHLRELEISLSEHDDLEISGNSKLEFLRLSSFWGQPLSEHGLRQFFKPKNLKLLDLYSAQIQNHSDEKEMLVSLLPSSRLQILIPHRMYLCPEIERSISRKVCSILY